MLDYLVFSTWELVEANGAPFSLRSASLGGHLRIVSSAEGEKLSKPDGDEYTN